MAARKVLCSRYIRTLFNCLRVARLRTLLEDVENNEFMNIRHNLATHFESIFQRLLSSETLDLYAAGVSSTFEFIAANLLAEVPDRKFHWYDGVVDLTASIRKLRQIEFKGEMWVGDERGQWKENFRARVTDKRKTKQGIWITLWIGSDRAEGELLTAFGLTE